MKINPNSEASESAYFMNESTSTHNKHTNRSTFPSRQAQQQRNSIYSRENMHSMHLNESQKEMTHSFSNEESLQMSFEQQPHQSNMPHGTSHHQHHESKTKFNHHSLKPHYSQKFQNQYGSVGQGNKFYQMIDQELSLSQIQDLQESEQSQENLRLINLKNQQLKLELKEYQIRLQKSEKMKEATLYELERLENENRFLQHENIDLRLTLSKQDDIIEQINHQCSQLKSIIKEKVKHGQLEDLTDQELDIVDNQVHYIISRKNSYHSDGGVSSNGSSHQQQTFHAQKPGTGVKGHKHASSFDLNEIRKALENIHLMQNEGRMNNEDSQVSTKHLQEMAILQQRVDLLEQNNQQLLESCNFQKESYHQVKSDFDTLTKKYDRLKEKNSTLKEMKERTDGQNKQLQAQLAQLKNEIDNSNKGDNMGSGSKKHTYMKQESQSLYDLSCIEGSPQIMRFDDQLLESASGTQQFGINIKPIQSLFDELNIVNRSNEFQIVNPNKEQEQIGNNGQKEQPNSQQQEELIKKNNELLTMILQRLNEVQNGKDQKSQDPLIPQKDQKEQQNLTQNNATRDNSSHHNAHSKQPSSSTNCDKLNSINTSNPTNRNSGNLSNLSSGGGGACQVMDFDGSVFPAVIGMNKHLGQELTPRGTNTSGSIYSKLKSVFSGNQKNEIQQVQQQLDFENSIEDGEQQSHLRHQVEETIEEHQDEEDKDESFDHHQPIHRANTQQDYFSDTFNLSEQDLLSKIENEDQEQRQFFDMQKGEAISNNKDMPLKSRNHQVGRTQSGKNLFRSDIVNYFNAYSSYQQKNQKSGKTRNYTSKPLNTTLLMRSSIIGNYLLSAYPNNIEDSPPQN